MAPRRRAASLVRASPLYRTLARRLLADIAKGRRRPGDTTLDIGRRIDPDELRRQTVLETIETKLGIQVGTAVEEISAGVTDRALAAHLEVPRGSPLVIVEMTFVDVSDRPIEYFKTSYRADRFTRRNQLERIRPTPSSKL